MQNWWRNYGKSFVHSFWLAKPLGEGEFHDLLALEENMNMRYLWQTLHGVTTIRTNATPILMRNGM